MCPYFLLGDLYRCNRYFLSQLMSPEPNLEFYELPFFDEADTWAIIGESGEPDGCINPEDPLCNSLWPSFMTVGQVFDLSRCEALSRLPMGRRIKSVIRQNPVPDAAHFHTNNFYALIDISGSLFSLSYSTNLLSEDSCLNSSELCSRAPATMTRSGTVLHLDKVRPSKAEHDGSVLCVFELEPI